MKKHSGPAAGGLEAKTLRGIIARWETRREYLNTNPSAYDAFIAREVAGVAEPALAPSAATRGEPVAWLPMNTAPKGYPTEDAGCRGTSGWFFGRVAKEFRKHGAAPFVVIRRKAWPHEDDWECNGEAHYVPRYFDGWRPLYDHPASAVESAQAKEALRPFVDALDGADDDKAGDGAHIWEAPVAMNITYGDLRRAAKAYASLDLAADAEEKP